MINKDVILADAETYYRKLVRKTEEYEQLEEKHKKLITDYKTLLHENESLIDECNSCEYKHSTIILDKIEKIIKTKIKIDKHSSNVFDAILSMINEVLKCK